jgi:hypothetical protein
MSFGPKVVDWACSLRKTKKWFWWQNLVLCMHPTPVFGMGDVRQRNCAKPPQTKSFGPKVVDWACSLRKTKKWFSWQNLVLCMHPTPVFGMGDVRQRNCAKPPQTKSFGPKVVDWACSLQKRRNGSGGKNSCFYAPGTRFWNG